MDIYDPQHEEQCTALFLRTCDVLEMPGFELRPLRRRKRGRGKFHSYALGYTRLDQKVITIDLYTPRTMKPRRIDAILRVACHELAHHQSPPRLIRVWFRIKRYSHHPEFWQQCKQNIERLQQDPILRDHFHST